MEEQYIKSQSFIVNYVAVAAVINNPDEIIVEFTS